MHYYLSEDQRAEMEQDLAEAEERYAQELISKGAKPCSKCGDLKLPEDEYCTGECWTQLALWGEE